MEYTNLYLHNYVYRIKNNRLTRYYIGVRSCDCLPEEDLGFLYFSSSQDKEFLQDQKQNPSDYSYEILEEFDTRELAINHEIYLHNKHNVGVNPRYYNRAKQTSTGFDRTGLFPEVKEFFED